MPLGAIVEVLPVATLNCIGSQAACMGDDMAGTRDMVEAPVNPWQTWDAVMDSMPLPAQLRDGNVPMPFVLQQILDSFVEFDDEAFSLDLREADCGLAGARKAPKLTARAQKSSAA